MKFSIRDLLLVTVIVALAVAWWVDRFSLLGKLNREEFREEERRLREEKVFRAIEEEMRLHMREMWKKQGMIVP